jgi:mannose-6-phosphate isomerase-like protein (cupin superfamily)
MTMTSPSDPPEEQEFRGRIQEDIRPWGKFRVFPHDSAGSLKIITVAAGGALSLQYHNRRSEFWVVLDIGLEVTVADRTWRPQPDEEIFIPAKAPHRVRNTGTTAARIMEIWLGDSSEEDIVRIEDVYGRS